MEKYLIEVPHGGDKASCHAAERILPAFYRRNAKITKIIKFNRKDMEESVLVQNS